MTRFAEAVTEYWRAALAGEEHEQNSELSIVVADALDALDADERVTVLRTEEDAHTTVALSPAVARRLAAAGALSAASGEGALRAAIASAGIALHGADSLFYVPRESSRALRAERDPGHVRRLDPEAAADAESFAEFEAAASPEDLDAGQVDLDDWAVYGAFDENGKLVSVASAYPWGESVLADFGVITLEDARGAGHARALTRALARCAAAEGLELQYRCQTDNPASAAVAASAGLALFGRWEIPTPDDADAA